MKRVILEHKPSILWQQTCHRCFSVLGVAVRQLARQQTLLFLRVSRCGHQLPALWWRLVSTCCIASIKIRWFTSNLTECRDGRCAFSMCRESCRWSVRESSQERLSSLPAAQTRCLSNPRSTRSPLSHRGHTPTSRLSIRTYPTIGRQAGAADAAGSGRDVGCHVSFE